MINMTTKQISTENSISKIQVEKVIVNIGVGRSGESIERAQNVLTEITNQTPKTTIAKKAVRDWGDHKGEPIGTIGTLRGNKAIEVLKKLFAARENKLSQKSFDTQGNFAFGIKEHIDIPGTKYDPQQGIWGMDVIVSFCRMGYRVKYRQKFRSKVGNNQRINIEDVSKFLQQEFNVEVLE